MFSRPRGTSIAYLEIPPSSRVLHAPAQSCWAAGESQTPAPHSALGMLGSPPPWPIQKGLLRAYAIEMPCAQGGVVSRRNVWLRPATRMRTSLWGNRQSAYLSRPTKARMGSGLPLHPVQVHRTLERTSPPCGSSSGCRQGQALTRPCRRKPPRGQTCRRSVRPTRAECALRATGGGT